jgi:arylsulfatase A-like enzyme
VRTLILACLFAAHLAAQGRPNIVFVMADDLGWMDLGCQGNERILTPHLDGLATQGARFTDAYAPAPVCSPTRAAIMTGRAPARLGLTNHIPPSPNYAPPGSPLIAARSRDRLPAVRRTLAELLGRSGYRTGFFGKWHLMGPYGPGGRGIEACAPDKQGFENNVGGCSLGGPPTFFDPYGIYSLPSRRPGEYLPDRLVDESIAWMKSVSGGDEPFFLTLWHYSPHWPMEAPQADIEAYLDAVGPGLRNPVYAAMVTRLDRAIGRLLAAIDELNLERETLFVFTSDNGGWDEVADNAPLRGGKGYLWEGGLRVPLIVRWPGVVEPGRVIEAPVVGTDLFPTFLVAAGVEVREPCDGVDLGPLLRGGRLERERLFWHYPNYAWHGANRPGGVVREGRWKLIERYADESLELYDLALDLGEAKNLAAEHPERAKAMSAALHAWLGETGARMPTRRR